MIHEYLARKYLQGKGNPLIGPLWAPLPKIPKVAPFVIRRLSDGLYYQGLEGGTDFPTEVWTESLSLAYVMEYNYPLAPGVEHVPVRRPPKALPKGVVR